MNSTRVMNEELSFANAFCSQYEALLDQCQVALSAWSDRCDAARLEQLTGEAVGRELLRLQARFAKSYDVLQKHVHSCERCVAASQVSRMQLERPELNSLPVC